MTGRLEVGIAIVGLELEMKGRSMKINWDIDEDEISHNGGIRESLERIVTNACPELDALHVSIRRLQDNRYICSLSIHPDGASEVMVESRHEDLSAAFDQSVHRLQRTMLRRDQVDSMLRELLQ